MQGAACFHWRSSGSLTIVIRRCFSAVLLGVALGTGVFAQQPAQEKNPSTTVQLPPAPLLPQSLGTWTLTDQKPAVTDTGLNDVINKELGVKRSQAGVYTSGKNQLSIVATQYMDATGAYAAFASLRQAGTHAAPAKIGNEAEVKGNEVLFWSGPTLVSASFQTQPDYKALETLTNGLPKLGGAAGRAPGLLSYLPKSGLRAESVKYAVGPATYQHDGGQLNPSIVDFSKSPEITTGQYPHGTFVAIYYPTPTIAGDRSRALLKDLLDHLPAGATTDSIAVRRAGPIVAITYGQFTAEEAKKLLDQVHYETNVTWNKPEGYISEASKAARLLVNIILGVFAMGLAALVLGAFFGGGRALIRVLQGKPASSMHDAEFIHLDLRQDAPPPPRQN